MVQVRYSRSKKYLTDKHTKLKRSGTISSRSESNQSIEAFRRPSTNLLPCPTTSHPRMESNQTITASKSSPTQHNPSPIPHRLPAHPLQKHPLLPLPPALHSHQAFLPLLRHPQRLVSLPNNPTDFFGAQVLARFFGFQEVVVVRGDVEEGD